MLQSPNSSSFSPVCPSSSCLLQPECGLCQLKSVALLVCSCVFVCPQFVHICCKWSRTHSLKLVIGILPSHTMLHQFRSEAGGASDNHPLQYRDCLVRSVDHKHASCTCLASQQTVQSFLFCSVLSANPSASLLLCTELGLIQFLFARRLMGWWTILCSSSERTGLCLWSGTNVCSALCKGNDTFSAPGGQQQIYNTNQLCAELCMSFSDALPASCEVVRYIDREVSSHRHVVRNSSTACGR